MCWQVCLLFCRFVCRVLGKTYVFELILLSVSFVLSSKLIFLHSFRETVSISFRWNQNQENLKCFSNFDRNRWLWKSPEEIYGDLIGNIQPCFGVHREDGEEMRRLAEAKNGNSHNLLDSEFHQYQIMMDLNHLISNSEKWICWPYYVHVLCCLENTLHPSIMALTGCGEFYKW